MTTDDPVKNATGIAGRYRRLRGLTLVPRQGWCHRLQAGRSLIPVRRDGSDAKEVSDQYRERKRPGSWSTRVLEVGENRSPRDRASRAAWIQAPALGSPHYSRQLVRLGVGRGYRQRPNAGGALRIRQAIHLHFVGAHIHRATTIDAIVSENLPAKIFR